MAFDGPKVIAVGRVSGAYRYDNSHEAKHQRPVQWIDVGEWSIPDPEEGINSHLSELGRYPKNLLALERRLLNASKPKPAAGPFTRVVPPAPLELLTELDRITAQIDVILIRKGQLILYGPPGTGKTYHALRAARELAARHAYGRSYIKLDQADRDEVDGTSTQTGMVRLIAFHPGYGYEDFVEGLRPKAVRGQLIFESSDGIFKKLCAQAADLPNQRFYLIVDEINRGDVPRTFGELMTVLEMDKRHHGVGLPLTGDLFTVPPNLFLIGTMNTADRSISLLDAALRRRFGFIELMPDSQILKGMRAGALPLGAWLDSLNGRIRTHLKREARNLQIGHAYLLPGKPIASFAEFGRILREDIIPLLEEYCYEDFATLQAILGSALVDADNCAIHEAIFEPEREADLFDAVMFDDLATAPEMMEAEIETVADPDIDGDNDDGISSNPSS